MSRKRHGKDEGATCAFASRTAAPPPTLPKRPHRAPPGTPAPNRCIVAPMTDLAAPEADLRRTDVFAWLKAQADALRAREAGRNAIDYDELAEEVDGLAQAVRNRCFSLTARIIEHLYKLEFADFPRDRPGWRKEVHAFRGGLARNITPTIQGEIAPELEALARRELRGLVTGELILDPAPVHAARPAGYT